MPRQDASVAIRRGSGRSARSVEDRDDHARSRAPRAIHTAPSLNSHQAPDRGPGRAATSIRSTKGKQTPPGPELRVLVVDDVSDVTEMIALLLKVTGYEVTTAESGAMALRLANENTFDLIISDIGMPEMNGYELAECLRGRAKYRDTPLIAVTGYSEYHDRARAFQAGFDAHLTKPIDPTELLNLVKKLLA